MIRKFKTLGLVLAAIFAMSAIGASAASAAEFHASSSPIGLTGTQTIGHVFTTSAGTITCTTATFSGTQTQKTSATMTLTPHYTTCKAFGFISIPIDNNGCAYVFNANGTRELECPAGKGIEWTVPGCTTTYLPQHLPSGTTFTTAGATPNRHISMHFKIEGIKYEECGTVRTNGKFTGSTTLDVASGETWVS